MQCSTRDFLSCFENTARTKGIPVFAVGKEREFTMVDRAVSRDRIGACRGLGVACRRGQGWVIFTVLVLLDDGCFDPSTLHMCAKTSESYPACPECMTLSPSRTFCRSDMTEERSSWCFVVHHTLIPRQSLKRSTTLVEIWSDSQHK
jgi:hypothetical protein